MKKSIIIILAVVAILVIWVVSVYNGLVTMDENVSGQGQRNRRKRREPS